MFYDLWKAQRGHGRVIIGYISLGTAENYGESLAMCRCEGPGTYRICYGTDNRVIHIKAEQPVQRSAHHQQHTSRSTKN